mgnify:CR=1 FL=1
MPIPMWPKMDHPGRREGSLVSTGRLLLHFLSIGARRPRASYTIPLNMIVRTTAMLFVNRLVHTLVPGSESEPVDASCRTNAGFSASLVCIGLNITLCLAKGIAGLLAGSVSLIADAFNNLSDASSNIVSLLGFRLASRPADEGHPYGHGRYEYLAGLFVAVLVCAVGINLILESVTKIIKPSPTAYTFISLAALATSMLVKLWMAAFNRTLGDRIDSETLIATAQDSKNDVITSGSVLVAALIRRRPALISMAGQAWVWASSSASAVWAWCATPSARCWGKRPTQLVQAIRDKIMSYPQVLGTHDLMVHDYGPGRQFASAHVEMPGEGDAFEHHEILDTIEHDIKRQMGIGITLHCDPIATTGDDLRGWVKRGVMQIDPALSIHDLHEHNGFVSFDLVRPDGFDISDEELLELVTRIVHERRPDASCVVTFDSGFSSPDRPAEQL